MSHILMSKVIKKRAPITCKKVCDLRRNGGLGVNDLGIWNTVTIMKLLWKAEKLWVRWMHMYFFKDKNVMEYQV